MNVSWHWLLSLRAGPFFTFMLDSLSISVPVGMSFIAVQRHHDSGSSYKGEDLIVSGLQFMFSPLASWREA